MAILFNTHTQQRIRLLPYQLIGRSVEQHHIVLRDKHASRMHSIIQWDGESWSLKDTSTNGTFVNENKVTTDTHHRLQQDDQLQFGHITSDKWVLINSDAPKSMLIPNSPDLPVIELNQLIALPSENQPEVTLYLSPHHEWICESPSGVSVLKHLDLVGTQQKTWRFIDAKAGIKTQQHTPSNTPDTPNIAYFFRVSQNEEHVFLQLNINNEDIDLGERAHHYLLLELARKYQRDTAAKIHHNERGWMDKDLLSRTLGMSESHINIQIYRLRKQLVNTFPQHHKDSTTLPTMIERRHGELRFTGKNITISGGLNAGNNTTEKTGDNIRKAALEH